MVDLLNKDLKYQAIISLENMVFKTLEYVYLLVTSSEKSLWRLVAAVFNQNVMLRTDLILKHSLLWMNKDKSTSQLSKNCI